MMKTCTNFGCGRQYREEDNDGRIDPCRHHPSAPFFHDAYKIWQCCGQKSTDFTTFLNCKPCQEGKHSDLKRKEEKKKSEEVEVEEVAKNGKEDNVEEEWDENEWTDLEVKESASVAKHVKSEKIIGEDEEVKTRRECKRCGRSEEDILLELREECCYHVGVSIFHDSLKYWSCCPQKKFTEFEEFKKFRGCRVEDSGHEMEAKNLKKKEPREDFFQTDRSVTIVLYGVKGARAATTRVKSNGKHVLCVLGDERGGVLWEKEWTLLERIERREGASVLIGSQKVEIAMRKWKKGVRWPQLTQ